ncbi:hypothetical protein, partial [Fulvimarina sp. MAC8]|uniref:hypothetical protein n=1 Tax=Fulvimarina sp. MAC8 TaxID=3162874 RepID=UPI0032EC6F3B
PFKGEPGSTVQGPDNSRTYGEDGYPLTDRDAGHSDESGIGAGDHSHDWSRPEGGGLQHIWTEVHRGCQTLTIRQDRGVSRRHHNVWSTRMNWTTDERGRLNIRGIHDGIVSKLNYDTSSRVFEISISSGRNMSTAMHFSGVIAINVSSLWENSIVSDVFVWDIRNKPDDAMLAGDIGWAHLLDGRSGDRSDLLSQIARYVKEIESGCLVTISCIYGGDISILSQNLDIEQFT